MTLMELPAPLLLDPTLNLLLSSSPPPSPLYASLPSFHPYSCIIHHYPSIVYFISSLSIILYAPVINFLHILHFSVYLMITLFTIDYHPLCNQISLQQANECPFLIIRLLIQYHFLLFVLSIIREYLFMIIGNLHWSSHP